MEGQYIYHQGQLSTSVVAKIKGEKNKIRICSLSRVNNNPLMWAHYADGDGHKAVVIGVEVDRINEIRKVEYIGPSHVRNANENGIEETAKRILSRKYETWSYEKEERIFVTTGEKFAKVKVQEIILGSKMSNADKSIIQKLIRKVAPDVSIISSTTEDLYHN